MRFSEAIAILEMVEGSPDTDQGLVAAYRVAMKKYHPDVTTLEPALALEMSKLVNEAFSFLQETMGKWSVADKGETSIANVMADVYNKIKHLPSITIERLGVWLWVTIDTPGEFTNSPADTFEERMVKKKGLVAFRKGVGAELKEHGFKYAPKKMKWSWHQAGDGPERWKRKGWDWNRIKSTFENEELRTSPRRAMA